MVLASEEVPDGPVGESGGFVVGRGAGPGVDDENGLNCPRASRPFAVTEALNPALVRATLTYSLPPRVSSQSLTSLMAIWVASAIFVSAM